MKKILSMVFIILGIIMTSDYLLDMPKVSAQDVWVYSSQGRNYYVMTETINYGQHLDMGGDGFSVFTKMTGNNNREILKIHWIFKVGVGQYQNSLGNEGNIYNESNSTLARHVFDYCINYINTPR